MNDDMTPDPRLRAALRHAPDTDLQAPPQLRAQLLAAARDAVRPKTRWWQRWLLPSPLGASGAFATLLLAGFITLLWRGEPPPAVVEPAAPAVAAAAPEPTPAPPPRQAERQALADRAAATARQVQQPARQAAEKAAHAANTAAAAAKAAATERAAETVAAGRLADAAPAPAPAPATAPAAAPVIAPTAAPPPPPPPMAAVPALSELRRAPATRMAALAPPRATGTDWLAAGVTWQIDGAAPVPADSAWLRDLLRLAEGRWQTTPLQALPAARQLLLGSGAARLALSLGDSELLWCETPAPCRVTPLSADEARRLRDALQR